MNIKDKLNRVRHLKCEIELDSNEIIKMNNSINRYNDFIDSTKKTLEKMLEYRNRIINQYNNKASEINVLLKMLEILPDIQKKLIIAIYFEHQDINKISKNINYSSEDVLRIHDAALKRLEEEY